MNLFHPVPAVSGIPLVYAWIRRGTCCYSMHSHGYARYCSLPVVSNMLLGQHGALLARPNPNAYCAAYTIACAAALLSSCVNVNPFKPFFQPAGAPPAPGPVSDSGQEGEHEVELLLNRSRVRGVKHYLVRRRSHTSVTVPRLATASPPEAFVPAGFRLPTPADVATVDDAVLLAWQGHNII